jgi:hypothetical protein
VFAIREHDQSMWSLENGNSSMTTSTQTETLERTSTVQCTTLSKDKHHRCETCVFYLEPGMDFNEITKKSYRSKWHRCSRFAVVRKREPAPGRESGHILPFEAVGRLHWKATSTALHVAPHGLCELWTGADGSSLAPRPETDVEREIRSILISEERPVDVRMFLPDIPKGVRDGYGLARRETVSSRPVVAGREPATFVLVVEDDGGGPEIEYSAA